jgi:hypothetical protein
MFDMIKRTLGINVLDFFKSLRLPALWVLGLMLGALLTRPVVGQERPRNDPALSLHPVKPIDPSDVQRSTCELLESAARANGLPVEFFARVIWQESRFQEDAMGPITQSGKRALGIAQFMPSTAAERNVLDPFNPVQALPKSAEFLRDLRDEFGNLGLAAAAYNAGPRRIKEWLAGSGPLPSETRNYVLAITGRAIEAWSKAGVDDYQKSGRRCGELMALLKHPRQPSHSARALERRPMADTTQQPGDATGNTAVIHVRMPSQYGELSRKNSSVIERNHGSPPRYRMRFIHPSRQQFNNSEPPGTTFKVVTPPRHMALISPIRGQSC